MQAFLDQAADALLADGDQFLESLTGIPERGRIGIPVDKTVPATAAGIYTVRVFSEGNAVSFKILIQ